MALKRGFALLSGFLNAIRDLNIDLETADENAKAYEEDIKVISCDPFCLVCTDSFPSQTFERAFLGSSDPTRSMWHSKTGSSRAFKRTCERPFGEEEAA